MLHNSAGRVRGTDTVTQMQDYIGNVAPAIISSSKNTWRTSSTGYLNGVKYCEMKGEGQFMVYV